MDLILLAIALMVLVTMLDRGRWRAIDRRLNRARRVRGRFL